MVLIRDRSPLRERLDAALAENKARHAEIHQGHLDRIAAKKQRMIDNGVPKEKHSC